MALRDRAVENKQTHLVMIQGIVNRLSQNAFLLKGWAVVLISAMFALAGKNMNAYFIYLAVFPSLAFWALDAYFLRQERLFRALYDQVRETACADIDFSMDLRLVHHKVGGYGALAISKTLSLFHGTLVGSIILVHCLIVNMER